MIKSCADCTTKCCKAGPGPHKVVSAEDWLYRLAGSDKYNTVCENHDLETGFCKLWNTMALPLVCKTFVCSVREYSEEELKEIDRYRGIK